ncbi:MAG: hypothetical protein KC583_13950, partial [Myxococcales bacterium]|nr:hypothetical protein [Myxococcales bacterium]
TPIDLRDDALEAQRRVALAERIVALARPAHTVFTVKAYWDLLRLDHVRLGLDTLLGVGARAPELCPPLVLGRGLLGGGWLPPRSPARAAERQILGQRLGSTAYTSQEPAS